MGKGSSLNSPETAAFPLCYYEESHRKGAAVESQYTTGNKTEGSPFPGL